MALATKCPHCNTIFRVAADQLKLRGGIVRCGSCHQVFDGNAALVEPAAKPTPVIPDVVAELAAPPAPVPAISDYVHGAPVDFELDFAEPAAPAEAKPVDLTPAAPAPRPAVPAPAVWRNAAATPAAETPPGSAARPAAGAAPAAVPPAAATPPPAEPPPAAPHSPDDTALAAVTRAFAAATTQPQAARTAPAGPHPLAALLSPDDAFSAATGDVPAAAPPTPAAPPPAVVAPPAAPPSPAIDEKLLAWEDIPANESAASDAAAMAAVARAFSAVTAHAPEQSTAAVQAEPVAEAPVATEAPAAAAPEPEDAEPAPVFPEEAPGQADEPEIEQAAATGYSAPAGAAQEDPFEQWPSDDGRIEPSFDTPQEHIVLAAIDDTHHFEDLPPDELPAAAPAAQETSAGDSWTGGNALSPSGEPWSLSEPEPGHDADALHAVAAVNTDVPDDGASLSEEPPAPAIPPKLSRGERALKRAQARLEAQAARDAETEASDRAAEEAAAAARMRAIAGVDEAEDLDHSDLSFVRRVERSQKYGKAITLAMALGTPLLLAGLALQAATTFRDTLAANYPQVKPTLAAICQPLGCKIALPAQLDALSVEPGELAAMAENTFSFSTVLRNQSKTVQAWPHLELTLNDNADKPVLRRVFTPREYLPSPAETDKGFGPHSEQSIKLYFELKDLKASGYHIAIFYP